MDSPEVSTKSKVEKWDIVDPIGSVVPAHHTDPGYQVPDEGKRMPLDDDSTPTAVGMEFKAAVEESVKRRRLRSTRVLMSKRSSSNRPRARFPGLREMTQRS